MRIIVICCLILPILSVDYLKILEENFDESISPCDNLYRYGCPINGTNFLDIVMKNYIEDIDRIELSKEYLALKEVLQSIMSRNESEGEIGEEVEQLCQNNREEYVRVLNFLKTITGSSEFQAFSLYDDCHEAAPILASFLHINYLNSYYYSSFSSILRFIEYSKIGQWHLNNRNSFERLKNTLTTIKSFASQLILTTPWITNKNYTKLYETVWNQLYFQDPLEREKPLKPYLDEYLTKSQSCVEGLNSNFLSPICYTVTIYAIEYPQYTPYNVFNAGNDHPTVDMANPFIYMSSLNLPPAYFLGSIAHVLAHEVSHSYIVSYKGDIGLPYFPNETRSCIQSQFENSCQFFAEGECETRDKQFDENGSDVFGYELVYEIFKFVYGENRNDIVKGSTKNITNAQLFFLSTSTNLCSTKPTETNPDDPHHAPVIRVNGIIAQNPDFGTYFNCPEKSKMIESKTDKCYVLGEHAPAQK